MSSYNEQKVFFLGAVALLIVLNPLLIAKVVVGMPVNKLSIYPVISSLDIGNPICYTQQSNGSTLDLSNLCLEDKNRTQLSHIDRNFLASYNNLLNVYQKAKTVITPDPEKDLQYPIKMAQAVCTALKNKVPLDKIETDQYRRITETEDPRNQKIALIESDIIDSLALKFYCPEFAK